MTDEITRLERRMLQLERQNHLMKAIAGFAVVLASGPFVLGAQRTDVVRASRFEVVRDGQAVVVLSSDVEGGRMAVYQTNGTLGGYVHARQRGTSLDFRDGKGNLAGYLDVRRDGGAHLCFMNPDQKECGISLISRGPEDNNLYLRSGNLIATLVRNGELEIFKSPRNQGDWPSVKLSASARFQLRSMGRSGGAIELIEDSVILLGADGRTRYMDSARGPQ